MKMRWMPPIMPGKGRNVDVSAMENLLESLLAKQLARVYELAGGRLDL